MRHAVEKYFRREWEKAAESYKPLTSVFFEQDIGKGAHIQREMPLFLTLRDDEGAPLVTAMLPSGRPARPLVRLHHRGAWQQRSLQAACRRDRGAGRAFRPHAGPRALLPVSSGTRKPRRYARWATIEQFAAKCHDALQSQPGTEGRKAVCALVKDVLKDREFVAKYIPEGTPERKVLYEDPELGFTILAHGYVGAKGSKPHDHGPSWAIYGQADGETIMTDWDCLARPERREARQGEACARLCDAAGRCVSVRHRRAALAAARELDAAAAHRGHEHGSGEALPLRGGGRAQPGRRIAFIGRWPE